MAAKAGGLEKIALPGAPAPGGGVFVEDAAIEASGTGAFTDGEAAGVRVNGAGFGGAAAAPNNTGGVLGLDVSLAATEGAGEAERAFFASSGE